MTLAIDKLTNEVVGQVADGPDDRPAYQLRQTITHNAENDRAVTYVRLLTRNGYRSVPLASVRLERVR